MIFQIRTFLFGSKIRNKFIFFFIILACVPVLVLGGTTLYFVDVAHRQDVSNLELQIIDQKIEEVESFFENTLGVLEIQVEAIETPVGSSSPWEPFLLENILESNPAFKEIAFIDTGGQESAKKSRFNDTPQLLYVKDLSSFQTAIQGRRYIGEVYFTLQGPMVTVAAPIVVNGVIAQVARAEVNLSSLLRSIATAKIGSEGRMLLVDRNGVLVSDQGSADVPPGTNILLWSRVFRVLAGETLTGLAARDRYESLFTSEAVVGAGKQIPDIKWALLVEWPISDADAVVSNIRNQILLITIVSIIVVLLVAPLFAARLVQPIRTLERRAKEIEQGEFGKQVEIKTGDELEELGGAFNKMAKGLKRLEELQEEFVFVAAHELRAPVTIIKGYVSMALEGDAGPVKGQMRKFLSQTQAANDRLLQLVEDLLQVARSEAGRITIEVKPLDIRKPTQETINQVQQLAKEKSIVVRYDAPSSLPNVLADERRITEIMMNLAGNAVKYTPEGGHVEISHVGKNNKVITSVKDNGFGISEEAQKKLFEKFYRIQTEKTKDISGTGLGLFITKEIIEKMNGKIWVTSKEGQGSTFSFSLPVAGDKPPVPQKSRTT